MKHEEKTLLWRVIYAPRVMLACDGFSAGPWHPDKQYVERCAASLKGLGPVGVQSNAQAARGAAQWPAKR
jgi:hypothetical protein